MRLLQTWFHGLNVRERALLTLFIWVILFAWAVVLIGATRTTWSAWQRSGGFLQANTELLERGPQIRAELETARAGVDNARTFSAQQLVGTIDGLARDQNLRFDISAPSTEESDLFSFHTVRVELKRAQLRELEDFEAAILAMNPYVDLAEFRLVANRRDPRFLDATFAVESFELKEDALP